MKFNIRLKLVLFTFSIVLLVGGGISLHSLFFGQRRLLTAFEDDARRTAALIAGAVANDLYFLELRSLRHRLESSRLNSDVAYTLIMDLEGAVLSDGTKVLRDEKPTDPFTLALLQANGWISKVEPGLLRVGGPVFMPDRTRVGYLNVGFSLQRINEVVRETTRSDLYLTAFAFGIAFVLAFALAASLGRPILTVTRAAKEIGEGKLDTRLSVSRSDELGTLAESVNLMAETLQRRDGEVKQTVELLEQEIAERNEAEESVRQSEERFRSLVSVITDVPWVTDAKGAFVTPQPAWEAYTGQTWEEHRGFGWANAVHSDDRERIKEIWNEARASHSLYQAEGRCWHAPTRQWRYVMAKATPLFNVDGNVREWVGTCTDVDDQKRAKERLENTVAERTRELQQANAALLRDMEERKKLEEQLRHAQKMESIGTLAGGIAHEFNNILNIIQGYASHIRLKPSVDRLMDEDLKIIDEQIKRAVSLVRQLLTVARRTATQLEPVDANDLVSAISELVKQSFPKTIEVALDLDPGLPPVMADSNQLSQAILNICVNARDAMPVGGKLTVRTEKIDKNKLSELRLEAPAESYVSFVISDTGMGMDGKVRARIFEPFFTTKGVGKGTGLGLAIVYGIVKEHNGFIDVESAPGLGTTLRIYLPVLRSEGKSAVNELLTEESASRKYASGQGTVLVVEDEEAMVHLLREALSQAGYQTLTAMNGEEAVDLYHQHIAEIDIVVLDLGLPKVSGFDVIHKLTEQSPSVSIIITTGYLQPDLKNELFQAGVKDCVYKPFVVDELVEKVGFLIDRSRRSAYQKTLSPPQRRAV